VELCVFSVFLYVRKKRNSDTRQPLEVAATFVSGIRQPLEVTAMPVSGIRQPAAPVTRPDGNDKDINNLKYK
jgi:hypothetical protein